MGFNKLKARLNRKKRCRRKIILSERPRLSVFKSNNNVYVQVIDDLKSHTLVSASSFENKLKIKADIDGCKEIGGIIAKRCLEKNINKVVFDRNGNRYHGRVKAIAEGARENGLEF